MYFLKSFRSRKVHNVRDFNEDIAFILGSDAIISFVTVIGSNPLWRKFLHPQSAVETKTCKFSHVRSRTRIIHHRQHSKKILKLASG